MFIRRTCELGDESIFSECSGDMLSIGWRIMPANLTPDYPAAERVFREAQTPQQSVAALEEMLACRPKHKGTEKLQADLKRRISTARKESQKNGGRHSALAYIVKRGGAGQPVDVVRFYSKPPGRKPDFSAPYVLRKGETVQDAAARVHRDFTEHLKFARLFRRETSTASW
jgi:ribosome-interacting GTPase 1